MADLRKVLEKHGISPARFLEKVRSPESCRWRKGRDCYEVPSEYVINAFLWGPPGSFEQEFWDELHCKWEDMESHDKWLELEAALGWTTTLEDDLREVNDG